MRTSSVEAIKPCGYSRWWHVGCSVAVPTVHFHHDIIQYSYHLSNIIEQTAPLQVSSYYKSNHDIMHQIFQEFGNEQHTPNEWIQRRQIYVAF